MLFKILKHQSDGSHHIFPWKNRTFVIENNIKISSKKRKDNS